MNKWLLKVISVKGHAVVIMLAIYAAIIRDSGIYYLLHITYLLTYLYSDRKAYQQLESLKAISSHYPFFPNF